MKKTILTLISALFLFTTASAEVGVNIGVSGTVGLYGATGSEDHSDTTSADSATTMQSANAVAAVGWGSVFLEKEFGMVAIGVDYVPMPFETETTETAKQDKDGSTTVNSRTNKVQADLEDLYTVYLTLNVADNAYVKAGIASVDVITNEDLETGSSYGNTTLDGTVIGMGYHKDTDAGFFLRAEANYTSWDSVSLTSADNTIKLKDLDGITATVSLGKSF